MSFAKLRHSRDVSELDPIKIENAFYGRDLDAHVRDCAIVYESEEYAHQVADLIAKSQLTSRSRGGRLPYVFSEGHRTAFLVREVSLW